MVMTQYTLLSKFTLALLIVIDAFLHLRHFIHQVKRVIVLFLIEILLFKPVSFQEDIC